MSVTASNVLSKQYGQNPLLECDILVALGGDRFLLSGLAMPEIKDNPVFEIELGTPGFLLHPYQIKDLFKKITGVVLVTIHHLGTI